MQVILTEEEYLKLKNQSLEDKKTYVKRIDVALAFQEMVKELERCSGSSAFDRPRWDGPFQRFIEKLG